MKPRAGMTLAEIKSAVEAGRVVCWGNPGYVVIKDSLGQWLVRCAWNGYCFGLTWADGVTVNGKPEDFFLRDNADGSLNSTPPHLDPVLVGRVRWRATVDRDHVGADAVGRFGNNAACWVVEILGCDGSTLWGERCDSAEGAATLAATMSARIEANRQQSLF